MLSHRSLGKTPPPKSRTSFVKPHIKQQEVLGWEWVHSQTQIAHFPHFARWPPILPRQRSVFQTTKTRTHSWIIILLRNKNAKLLAQIIRQLACKAFHNKLQQIVAEVCYVKMGPTKRAIFIIKSIVLHLAWMEGQKRQWIRSDYQSRQKFNKREQLVWTERPIGVRRGVELVNSRTRGQQMRVLTWPNRSLWPVFRNQSGHNLFLILNLISPHNALSLAYETIWNNFLGLSPLNVVKIRKASYKSWKIKTVWIT